MKQRILQTIVALVAIVSGATAQTLSIAAIEAMVGEQAELVVSASGMSDVTALQFNLALPQGVTLNESAITTGEAASRHTLSVQTLDNGDRLIVLYHTDLALVGNGTLLRLPITVGQQAGSYNGNLYTVRTATTDAASQTCADAAFSIMVKAPEQPVTITADNLTMTYGDDVPTLTYKSEGGELKGTPKLSTTATKTSPVGTYPITVEQGTVANTQVTYVTGTLTITKAPLTVTANSYTIKQGEALPTFAASYSGFKNNETEAVLTKKPTLKTTATSGSAPGTYDITASGAEAKNYDIKYVAGKLTIAEADPITVTVKSISREYGEANPAFDYTVDGGTLDGMPTISCTATAKSDVGTYDITIAKGTVKNYNVTFVAGKLTVTKAPLTIKAGTYTKKQGEKNPEFTLTYEGFKNGETEAVLTKKPTATTTATTASAVGDYEVKVSGAEAKNYEISYVNGTLKVTDADAVVVTAKSYTRTYGDKNPTFEYTSQGAALDGKPEISCEATESSPVGTYPIVIKKGSVKNYNDTYVNGTLTITKAPLMVGVKDETITEGEAIPAFTLTYDGFKNSDTETSAFTKKPVASTTATSKSEAGTYPITVSGGEAKNYALSYEQGTLTIEAPSVPKDVDLTDRVGTSQSDWNAGGVCATEFAPAITTSDGRQAQMMETYEETVETTGEMMYQVVTGLENGDYAVELYANAQYTDGRGFDSNLTDGARKVVYVSANDRRCYVTAHIGTAVSQNSVCTVYTQVKDGTLRLGLTAEQPGTNWHTLQIKKLTLLRHGTVIYADDKTREEGTANPQWTYTVSGTAVTGKPTLSRTAGMYASPGCWIINVGKGTVKSDQPIYLQPGVLTITIPVGIGQVSADEQSEPIYDLQGRRVDATVLRKGLYIRGGKVIILGK